MDPKAIYKKIWKKIEGKIPVYSWIKSMGVMKYFLLLFLQMNRIANTVLAKLFRRLCTVRETALNIDSLGLVCFLSTLLWAWLIVLTLFYVLVDFAYCSQLFPPRLLFRLGRICWNQGIGLPSENLLYNNEKLPKN